MSQHHKRPNFEILEPRLLLDGNVMAAVVAGDLILTGDAADNAIRIDQTGLAGDHVCLSPADAGTSLNGQDDPMVLTGITGDVRIRLGDGNDWLEITDLTVAGRLIIEANRGEDELSLRSVAVGEDLRIANGSGWDILFLQNLRVAGKTTLTGGGIEGDTIILEAAEIAGDLTVVNAGRSVEALSSMSLAGCRIDGNVTISLGGGHSETTIAASTIGGDLRIESRGGYDSTYDLFCQMGVQLTDSLVEGDTTIRAGAAEAFLHFRNSTIGGDLKARSNVDVTYWATSGMDVAGQVLIDTPATAEAIPPVEPDEPEIDPLLECEFHVQVRTVVVFYNGQAMEVTIQEIVARDILSSLSETTEIPAAPETTPAGIPILIRPVTETDPAPFAPSDSVDLSLPSLARAETVSVLPDDLGMTTTATFTSFLPTKIAAHADQPVAPRNGDLDGPVEDEMELLWELRPGFQP